MLEQGDRLNNDIDFEGQDDGDNEEEDFFVTVGTASKGKLVNSSNDKGLLHSLFFFQLLYTVVESPLF